MSKFFQHIPHLSYCNIIKSVTTKQRYKRIKIVTHLKHERLDEAVLNDEMNDLNKETVE
jgi:hypothetical protein